MTKRFSLETPYQLHIIIKWEVNTDLESENSNNYWSSLYSAGILQQNVRFCEWSTGLFTELPRVSSIAKF